MSNLTRLRPLLIVSVVALAACDPEPADGLCPKGGCAPAPVPECGNGKLASGEGCDDGNTKDGDGCSPKCAPEAGYTCTGAPSVCVTLPTPSPLVRDLALGGSHTCALESGVVRCWGENGGGQLGLGHRVDVGDDETPGSAPAVNLGGVALAIEAGSDHTCALLEGGKVRCWGQPDLGRLGYGSATAFGAFAHPASAGDVPVGGAVTQLALGHQHTCAVLTGGAVRCWGTGEIPVLGYGRRTTIGDDETPASAGDVAIAGRAVQVVAGVDHTCVLLDDGRVRCWGLGARGQLGYGKKSNAETPSEGLVVDVGDKVGALAAGDGYTCALLPKGRVRCWGTGPTLGLGKALVIGDDEAPSKSADVALGGVAVELAAGLRHVCARLDTGAVRCWGEGDGGRLGLGDTRDIGDDETPASVDPAVTNATRVSAGGAHTCVRRADRSITCWGAGASGQLGQGRPLDLGDDEAVATIAPINLTGSVCGDGVVDPTEACDDRNDSASDGCDGCTIMSGFRCEGAPSTCDAMPRIIQIAAGEEHTCALSELGTVRCWGDNSRGQLGYGDRRSTGDIDTPRDRGDVPVGGVVVALSLGGRHTCALLEGGKLRCWGEGARGRLGYGDEVDIGDDETPASVGDVPTGRPVTAVFAGGDGTCIILDDGTSRCFGAIPPGRRPDVPGSQPIYPAATSVQPDLPLPAVAFAVGGAPCALLDDGTVWCWSVIDDVPRHRPELGAGVEEVYGGNGPTCARSALDRVTCFGVPPRPDDPQDYVRTFALAGPIAGWTFGNGLGCLISEAGAVRCFGGLIEVLYPHRMDVSELVTGWDDTLDVELGGVAVQVTTGWAHACVLLDTGRVRCWGSGGPAMGYGIPSQSAIGDDEPVKSVPPIAIGEAVSDVASGGHHTCVVLPGGRVRCFGESGRGVLGYPGQADWWRIVDLADVPGDVDVGGPVQALALGDSHTCALLVNGRVRCWGDGRFGRLGYGSTETIGDDETPASAGDIDLGGTAVQIAAGKDHTCARLDNGKVRCWGEGTFAKLGYRNELGVFEDIGDDETPASAGDVNLGGSAIDVDAGSDHTCAVLATGKVRCWGSNFEGQLGYPHTNAQGDLVGQLIVGDDESPASMGDVSVGGAAVVKVEAFYHSTCALTQAGQVRCWGDSQRGEHGRAAVGTIGDDELPSVAAPAGLGAPAIALAGGTYFNVCAILSGGPVRCWGADTQGMLGLGIPKASPLDYALGDDELPVSAPAIDLGAVPTAIDVGSHTVCATLTGGGLRCWGKVEWTQAGDGRFEDWWIEPPAVLGDVLVY